MIADLPWSRPFHRRCRARLEPNPSGFWGRCELAPHDQSIDHALERGMDIPRWSTRFTDGSVIDPPIRIPVPPRGYYPKQTGGAHPTSGGWLATKPVRPPSGPAGQAKPKEARR